MSFARHLALRSVACLFLASCLSVAGLASAASPQSFKTPEYWNSTGLEICNAAEAYALGYTGQGVTLGIIDSPLRLTHPEIAGKVQGMLLPEGYPLDDWERDDHGSHVAGIMAARRNGVGMQGVAYDAELLSGVLDWRESAANQPLTALVRWFADRPDVKVINNSWGEDVYPYETGDSVQAYRAFLKEKCTTAAAYTLGFDYGKLMVFAAGNQGHVSPGGESIAPRYVPALANWLNVISLDPAGLTVYDDGSKTGDVQVLSIFSNQAEGAELFSVSAPGTNINSLDARGTGTGYQLMSGTSMAAPYVTGVLGLVQQAFPWMTTKQLADAVLTTADNADNGRFTPPAYTVSIEETKVSEKYVAMQVVLHAIDQAAPTDVTAALHVYYNKSREELLEYRIRSFAEFLKAYNGDYSFTGSEDILYDFSTVGRAEETSFEAVFGQGIVNAGLAVRGPAILDANRLTHGDYSAHYNTAFYTVDTLGHSGVFGNDISQRQWDNDLHHRDYQFQSGDSPDDPSRADAVALIGQDVGLLKDGAGTLVLSGYNTYLGATVVRGGVLDISRREDDAVSGTLTASNVTVESAGTLTGDGAVLGGIANHGRFLPGGEQDEAFTVGTYDQFAGGNLVLRLDSAGEHARLAAGTLRLHGGSVTLAAMPGYYRDQTMRFAFADLISGNVAATGYDWSRGVVAGWDNTLTGAGLDWASPTLTATAATQGSGATPTGLTLTFSRAGNAYSRYAATGNDRGLGAALDRAAGAVTGDAENLVAALDFSAADGSQVRSALGALGPRQFAVTARAALASQRDLTNLLLDRLLGAAVGRSSGPASVASGEAAPGGWRAFVTPLGGGSLTRSGNGLASSSATWAGALAGLEADLASEAGDWTLGAHLGFLHRDQFSGGPGTNSAASDGVHLGGQFRFVPRALATDTGEAQVFGLARVGLESTSQSRGVDVNGFARTARSDWVSPVGSLVAGGGWSWIPGAAGGRLRLGPVGWLDYAAAWRPSVAEHGGGAANLRVTDAWAQSLRTSLGVRAGLDLPTGLPTSTVAADLTAVWNHELLGETATTRARFAAFGGGFDFHDTVRERDSLTLAATVSGKWRNGLSLGLSGGTELGAKRSAAWGGLNLGLGF